MGKIWVELNSWHYRRHIFTDEWRPLCSWMLEAANCSTNTNHVWQPLFNQLPANPSNSLHDAVQVQGSDIQHQGARELHKSFWKTNISPNSSCPPLDNVWPYCPSTRHFFRIKIHAIMNKKRPRIMTLQLPKLTKNRILGETRGSYWVPATGYTCHWRHHLGSRCLICPPYSPAKPWRCIHTPPHSLAYCSHIVSNIQDTQLYCAHSSPPIQKTPRAHTCALPELPASQPAKSVLLKRVWLKSRPLQGKWALGWGFGVTMGQMQWRSRVAQRVTTHMSRISCVTFSS